MPHGVTYVESGVRWGVLLTYRTMDPNRRIRAAPQVPWVSSLPVLGCLFVFVYVILRLAPELHRFALIPLLPLQ